MKTEKYKTALYLLEEASIATKREDVVDAFHYILRCHKATEQALSACESKCKGYEKQLKNLNPTS